MLLFVPIWQNLRGQFASASPTPNSGGLVPLVSPVIYAHGLCIFGAVQMLLLLVLLLFRTETALWVSLCVAVWSRLCSISSSALQLLCIWRSSISLYRFVTYNCTCIVSCRLVWLNNCTFVEILKELCFLFSLTFKISCRIWLIGHIFYMYSKIDGQLAHCNHALLKLKM